MGNTEQQTLNDFLQNSIVEIIEDNYNKFTGTNEAILHSSEDIVDFINGVFREVPNSVELIHKSVESEEVNSLSAEDCFYDYFNTHTGQSFDLEKLSDDIPFPTIGRLVIEAAESFASMRVEQERKNWEKEKQEIIDTYITEAKKFYSKKRKISL